MGLHSGFPGIGDILSKTKSLAQVKTNGASKWGTFFIKCLPLFLGDGPHVRPPWGDMTAIGSSPYKDFPKLGVTRHYSFNISRSVIAPDGYEKDVLLINGAFPGPLIEANWGDWIEVKVCNNINHPPEGTALHWHGFPQTHTPWEDGVPSVSQCPITPGKCYTYRFRASYYGTTWYHAHYSAQYSGGLFGPIVVYGPRHARYDIDLGPIMLSDWYHMEYYDIVKQITSPNGRPPFSDNNLINGKANFNCSNAINPAVRCYPNAGISKFLFTPGKTHRLRLINSGAEATQRFSIDEHTMTVITNDFTPIEPYDTKVVTLGVGQRADVLVKAKDCQETQKGRKAFWIRSNITCSDAKQPYGLAALYYDGADTSVDPDSIPWDMPDPKTCANDDLVITKPLFKMKLPEPSFTMHMDISVRKNASNVTHFLMDHQEFRGNYNEPVLLHAFAGNLTFPAEWNVKNFGSNSSVRIVLHNHTPISHPIHLHSMLMYVLHEGPGYYDNATIINQHNPIRRDVHMLRANGHLVIQFDADDNPGAWPLHCHVAWHSSLGFFSTLVLQPERIQKYKIPPAALQLCKDWDLWSNFHVSEQIDSGL